MRSKISKSLLGLIGLCSTASVACAQTQTASAGYMYYGISDAQSNDFAYDFTGESVWTAGSQRSENGDQGNQRSGRVFVEYILTAAVIAAAADTSANVVINFTIDGVGTGVSGTPYTDGLDLRFLGVTNTSVSDVAALWGMSAVGTDEINIYPCKGSPGGYAAKITNPYVRSQIAAATAGKCAIFAILNSAGTTYYAPVGTTTAQTYGFQINHALSNNFLTIGKSYLDNGTITIGVDLGLGGAITLLKSDTGYTTNLVNSFDPGREIQQSYYYGNQNPVQAGDSMLHHSTLLAWSNTGSEIYTKSQPLEWGSDFQPVNCYMEQWTTISGNVATVRNRLTSFRTDSQPYSTLNSFQEEPAIYTIGELGHNWTYNGLYPFTSGALTEITTGTPAAFTPSRTTEKWSAWVNNSNFGVGVFNPRSGLHTSGFSGTRGVGGPTDQNTGYLCPLIREHLDLNIVYDFEYKLMVGSLTDIRNYAYANLSDTRPTYQFNGTRAGWWYDGGDYMTDSGQPIGDHLHVNMPSGSYEPKMIGPFCGFRASDVPTIYICAAYSTACAGQNLQIFWEVNNVDQNGEQTGFPYWKADQSYAANVIADGQYHVYELPVSQVSTWSGLISCLRFDPILSGADGRTMDIKYIAYTSTSDGLLSNGRQIILNSGLQIEPVVNPAGVTNTTQLTSANFSAYDGGASSATLLQQLAPGTLWGRQYGLAKPWTFYLDPTELLYGTGHKGLQYDNECSDIMNASRQVNMAASYRSWNRTYPNSLAFTNSSGASGAAPSTLANLVTYMQTTRPDMVCFDYYPSFSFPAADRGQWYSVMQRYRSAALQGHDGAGTRPIACGQYLNLRRSSYTAATPSESYVRLQQFASWAFGFTWLSASVYNDPGVTGVYPVMFSSAGDSSPTAVFTYVANANAESRKLGSALTRLKSSDIRIINGTGNSTPSGMTAWSSGAGCPRLTGITRQSGVNRDILIGYFTPLKASNPDYTWVNQTATTWHFMVANGAADGTASASTATIRLTFTGVTAGVTPHLEKINRSTGAVTAVTLTTISSTSYRADVALPGGTGELLKFYY